MICTLQLFSRFRVFPSLRALFCVRLFLVLIPLASKFDLTDHMKINFLVISIHVFNIINLQHRKGKTPRICNRHTARRVRCCMALARVLQKRFHRAPTVKGTPFLWLTSTGECYAMSFLPACDSVLMCNGYKLWDSKISESFLLTTRRSLIFTSC